MAGAVGPSVLRRALRWLDANAERALMLPLYAFIAIVVGGEAVLRYLVGVQTQWGGTMAIHAFIFLSWLGCAYHVRRRTHLSFDAVRRRLPARARCIACLLDDLLWIGLAAVVIVYSLRMAQMQADFASTVEGTTSLPLWIVTATVPLSWLVVALRAAQNVALLACDLRRGDWRPAKAELAPLGPGEPTILNG